MRMAKSIGLRLGAWLLRDRSPKAVFYHDISKNYTPMGTSAKVFWAHMEALSRHRVTGGARHCVCFDDGFRGIWDAREQLAAAGIRPMVFIAVDLIGRANYLSWEEVLTLQRDYGFDFQSHTWSHQTLAGPPTVESGLKTIDRTEAWFAHELADAKTELERRLGKAVEGLCFPVGYFNAEVVRRCAAAGYKRLYASFPGNLPRHFTDDVTVIPRCLCQFLSVGDFRAVLNGGMNLFVARYRRRCWVE